MNAGIKRSILYTRVSDAKTRNDLGHGCFTGRPRSVVSETIRSAKKDALKTYARRQCEVLPCKAMLNKSGLSESFTLVVFSNSAVARCWKVAISLDPFLILAMNSKTDDKFIRN